jgi:hypothetical protein
MRDDTEFELPPALARTVSWLNSLTGADAGLTRPTKGDE